MPGEDEMANANSSIAVIPSSNFKWTAQIQYKESLFTRDEAIRYASQYGCNLIVKYEKRTGPLFDVLQDPNLACASEDSGETVETVSVLAEPESTGWSRLMLRGVFGLAKRLGAGTPHRERAIPSALAVK
jgi:hypothetical protein